MSKHTGIIDAIIGGDTNAVGDYIQQNDINGTLDDDDSTDFWGCSMVSIGLG